MTLAEKEINNVFVKEDVKQAIAELKKEFEDFKKINNNEDDLSAVVDSCFNIVGYVFGKELMK